MKTERSSSARAVTRSETKSEIVELRAVYEGDANKNWAKWTPNGHLSMTISQDGAQGRFEPGKEYFLDITPADEDAPDHAGVGMNREERRQIAMRVRRGIASEFEVKLFGHLGKARGQSGWHAIFVTFAHKEIIRALRAMPTLTRRERNARKRARRALR